MSSLARCGLLFVAATALAFLFRELHLPAAWLFGPLVASALFAVRGWEAIVFPKPVYLMAQAVIGTALGGGFLPSTLQGVPSHLGIFLFAIGFTLATSLLNGWVLARYAGVDPPTAFLGTMPGGAGTMAAMSDSLGADTRLVTAMQYTRLLLILASLAAVASVLHHFWPLPAFAPTGAALLPPPAHREIGVLILLAAAGWLAALKTPIPAAAFLVPCVLFFLLTTRGVQPGTWPWPVLAAAYGVMGLQIGGRFHPSTLRLIRRILLPVVGTTIFLLLASLALAWIVARGMNLSLLAAYLAATPGGLDSVAAVATELRVDVTVVLAMHLIRVLCVLILGPWLVRGCSRWMKMRHRDTEEPGHPICRH